MPPGMPQMPNMGMPQMGMPNTGMPNTGMPNMGMPTMGMPQGGSFSGQAVDLTGDGVPNAMQMQDANGNTTLKPMPGQIFPTGMPYGQVQLDLTGVGHAKLKIRFPQSHHRDSLPISAGDGLGNVVGIDTTGDGIVDTLQQPNANPFPDMYQQQQQQMLAQGAMAGAPGGGTTISVEVPPNACPGMTMQIQHPLTGQQIEITVPPGAAPGATLNIQV